MADVPVVISDHAAERCRRRGIDPNRIVKQCHNLPPVQTSLKWRIPNGPQVIIARKADRLLIVTVYWPKFRHKRVKW